MNKDALVIGLALFAMFFGAGNLIFPPYLGMESGNQWPIGLMCFVGIDVVLSCLGIYAINAAGGSIESVERVLGKTTGFLLNTTAILCTGVLIASPRTAATTYEMAIKPLFGNSISLLIFSLIFFGIVLVLTIRPLRIVDIVGKILTPLLVAGIVVMIVAGIVNPLGPVEEPITKSVVADGTLAGYQTMDILAIIGFSIIVQETVRGAGYKSSKDQLSVTARASFVACVLLAAIYGGLTYLGASAVSVVPADVSQAALIATIMQQLLGEPGLIMLGLVVGLACLTTAIGLIGATADYAVHVSKGRVKYEYVLITVVVIALLICNLGLSNIITLAAPILSIICPPFMTTVILLLFRKHIKTSWVYKGAAIVAIAVSVFLTINDLTGALPWVTQAPLYEYGFSWLIPSAFGALLGGVLGPRLNASSPARAETALVEDVDEVAELSYGKEYATSPSLRGEEGQAPSLEEK